MYHITKLKSGHYVRLAAQNGQVILRDTVGYEMLSGAENHVALIQKYGADKQNFVLSTAKDGTKYFVLKSPNGTTLGISEMYHSEAARENGIQSVMKNSQSEIINIHEL
jgi:uncharacterized protein YegP (UPF0339 family)